MTFLNLYLGLVYNFDLKIDNAIVFAVVANNLCRNFQTNWSQFNFLANFTFVSLDLGRVYNFDLEINTYVAIFRPVGARFDF